MKLVEKRLLIDAPPARVYELITDASLLVHAAHRGLQAAPTPEADVSG